MNDWVCPRLKWDDAYRPDRGSVLDAAELDKHGRSSSATRPRRATHVAARTLPGVHPKGAFFTRGSGHNKLGGYTEVPDEYQEVMDRLARKHKARRRSTCPAPDHPHAGGADDRRHHRSAAATGACARRIEELAERGHQRRLHARARLPVRRRGRGVPRRARARSSSSSRTATRSCARCSTIETSVAKEKLRVGAGLRRLPAVGPPRRRRRHRASSQQLEGRVP